MDTRMVGADQSRPCWCEGRVRGAALAESPPRPGRKWVMRRDRALGSLPSGRRRPRGPDEGCGCGVSIS